MKRAWSIFFSVWSLLFIVSAFVQLNDVDGWIWVGIYLIAAAVSAMAAWGRYPTIPLAIGSVLCLVGTVYWFPSSVSEWVMQEWEQQDLTMKTVAMEEARESFGLLLIALVFIAALWVGWRKKKKIKNRYGSNYLS